MKKHLNILWSTGLLLCAIMGLSSCSRDSFPVKSLAKPAAVSSVPLPYGKSYWKYACMDPDSAKTLITAAPIDDQIWFWKTKMATEAASPLYSPIQKSILLRMERLIDSVYFDTTISQSVLVSIDQQMTSQIKGAFAQDTARRIFASTLTVAICDPATDPYCRNNVRAPNSSPRPDRIDCDCNTASDWCLFSDCKGTCSIDSNQGCGTFLRFPCQGGCQ